MFITHRPTITFQLHNFDVGLVVQVVSALLRGNWQDFNWHDAPRGPWAIAELLVQINEQLLEFYANLAQVKFKLRLASFAT